MTPRTTLTAAALLLAGVGAAVAQMNLTPGGSIRAARPEASQSLQRVAQPAPRQRSRAQTDATPANRGPANALQGFSQNRNEPVKIAAATLEVRDKEKIATFTGNVHLVQGDTTLRCASLVVHYEDDPKQAGTMTTAPGTPGGQQRIRRLEAKGGVRVIQKDQTAIGDSGVFDMRANTVTLFGNVTVSRGEDVLRGQKLVVDMTNGVSRMEAGPATGGRVEGLFTSSGGKPALPGRDGRPQRAN